MTTYNTGNPVGSTEAKDLYDNAENLDIAINSDSADAWTDRLGQARKTWLGIQNEAQLEISQVVGEVTAQSQQYLDASIVARDEARAAASASGPIAFFGTYAAAQAAVGGLPADGIVEVSQDETRAGARTRYKVQGGSLVFVVNLDQLRLDLAEPTGSAQAGYLPSGTGAIPTTVQGKLREHVSVKDFGAVGDGVADDTSEIQAAANYAAANHKELYFPDGTYKVTSKISIDGAATSFRSVRWRGTYCSSGPAAGYAPDLGRSGSTIITSGNAALEVWFRRFFNENLSIRGIAFVDTSSVYPGAITAATAIKLIKGDPATYPAEKRYITNHVFEDVAVYGYADAVVFRGSYRKDAGGAYTDNYFGPISFIRFYPYQCGAGIVAENATLNRLRVAESLFFSLTSGAIVKREAADIPVGARTETIIMCQLDMVHFEDVRGIFRFSGAPPANEFFNYVSMNDVTRELCGLFDATTGNPYGIIEYTNLIINGRHDQWGEVTVPSLGFGSSVTSQTQQSLNVLAGPGVSKSPDRINVTRESFSLVSGGASLIKGLALAEGLGNVFDVTSRVVIDGGARGIKTFHSYGLTQVGTVGRWHESAGNIAAGITVDVATASGAQMQEFIVTNSTGATVTVDIVVERNNTGCQLYLA